MPQAYLPTCPACGKTLGPVALGPEHAPWRCSECHLGFWTAQLTPEARALFRPVYQDFGYGAVVRKAVEAEAREALVRGTSLRHDQVGLAPKAAAALVSSRRVSAEFAQHVASSTGG